MDKKDILCPDCGITYISQDRNKEYGKCVSCYRREVMAKSRNMNYVRYIDLSDVEKDNILRQREIKRNSAKRIRDEKKNNKIKKETIKETNISSNMRKNQIYTPEIIDKMRLVASSDITPKELLDIMLSLYPDSAFNMSNLNNIIARYNIPHSSKRGRKPKNKCESVNITISNDIDDIDFVDDNSTIDVNVDNDVDDVIENAILDDIDIVDKPTNLTINYENRQQVEPERFAPIRAEIDNVLDNKFRSLGCNVTRDYTTQDYVEMLEMLLYLVENGNDLIRKRRNQQNIMNAYQSDMIHEFENVIVEDGDTSLSDKMYIIRNYRRHFECDYKDIATLRPLRDSLDVNMLKQVLTALKCNLNFVENPIFKPLIDTTLVDKYDWAQPLDQNSAKARISVANYNPNGFQKGSNNGRPVTRLNPDGTLMGKKTPPTDQLNTKTRKKLKIFRVSCRISGGGYGVFKLWYRDYECTNSKTALSYATNTLNQLASTRKGMCWTDLDVVELNVGPIKEDEPTVSEKMQQKIPEKQVVDVKDRLKFMGSRNLITNIDDDKNRKYYKITCQLSGGGIGVFKDWQRTYTCLTEIEAKQAANDDLAPFKEAYPGLLVTALKCVEVKVGG